MFAGHIGVALAAGRPTKHGRPRVPLGVLVAAALGLDVLLWLFILLGWESVTLPADYSTTHQPAFDFPYTHGLVASLAWSALAAALVLLVPSVRKHQPWRAGMLVAAVVFSHWLLDALVHRPEMPLLGGSSPRVGIGLWNHMPLALVLEALLVVIGLCLFLLGGGLPRGRQIAIAALSLVILLFTVTGMTVAPAPPSATAMAGSSLVMIAVVCLLYGWFGRGSRRTRTGGVYPEHQDA